MKKIVHLLFIVIGGTVGFLYGPGFIRLLNITEAGWVTSSYFGSALGAIILFLISYLLVDNIVDFLRWIERSEEHTSELQSRGHLVCRLLLAKKHATQRQPP